MQTNLAELLPNDTPLLLTDDTNLNITSSIVNNYLCDEILGLLKCYKEYGVAAVRASTMKRYVTKLKAAHHNTISDQSHIVQELFLLHQTCKYLYYYNQNVLGMSHTEFRARVLFPNIVYMLVRYLPNAYRFLQDTVRTIYNEISRHSYGVIQKYSNAYYLDHDLIRTDVLYEFLGNGLKKFDPLTIENIRYFYKQIFRKIFFYYFKKEQKVHTSYASLWDIDKSVGQMMSTPARLSIYRDVLYSLQVEKFCNTSPTLNQLSYNYSIFKNVIVNNEFQNMCFSIDRDTFMLKDNQYKLMKLYNGDAFEERLVSEIKELPLIYQLLKCVHIINPKVKPYNEMMIKPETVKTAVLEELTHPFRNMFSDSHIHAILEKIASNFTQNILSGEYINLLTLSSVKINHVTFIPQIKKFVNLCVGEALANGRKSRD